MTPQDVIPVITFSARVQRRYELFWHRPRLSLHTRGVCQRTYLTRQDPMERWRCCEYWQRKLSNKWNSREFAAKHGCRVPELYWHGSRVADMPLGPLPDTYVVRAVVGHSRQAVLVLRNGVNLVTGERYDHDRIREAMRPHVRGFPRGRVLIEEFIPPEPGTASAVPRDYKFHVFAGRIASVAVIERGTTIQTSIFDEEWRPLPTVCGRDRPFPVAPRRPDAFDDMCAMARTLGRAIGSYSRIDLYAGPSGAVFGEFTATPSKGTGFTAFGDTYLGTAWAQECPDTI